jgi:hypothetical protein
MHGGYEKAKNNLYDLSDEWIFYTARVSRGRMLREKMELGYALQKMHFKWT